MLGPTLPFLLCKVALDLLQEIKKENAKQAALRRQELKLLREEAPGKAAELEKAPAAEVGREVLDKRLEADPHSSVSCTQQSINRVHHHA